MHVSLDQVFAALGSYLGSSYVDQFNKFGRVFQIYVQGDAQSRLRLEDIENMFVRNKDGQMIPLGTLVKITPTVGPSLISLFNLYPTATIIGLPADGFSGILHCNISYFFYFRVETLGLALPVGSSGMA